MRQALALPVFVGLRTRRPSVDRCEEVCEGLRDITLAVQLKGTTQVPQLEKLTPYRRRVVHLQRTGNLLRLNRLVEVLKGVDERLEG